MHTSACSAQPGTTAYSRASRNGSVAPPWLPALCQGRASTAGQSSDSRTPSGEGGLGCGFWPGLLCVSQPPIQARFKGSEEIVEGPPWAELGKWAGWAPPSEGEVRDRTHTACWTRRGPRRPDIRDKPKVGTPGSRCWVWVVGNEKGTGGQRALTVRDHLTHSRPG